MSSEYDRRVATALLVCVGASVDNMTSTKARTLLQGLEERLDKLEASKSAAAALVS